MEAKHKSLRKELLKTFVHITDYEDYLRKSGKKIAQMEIQSEN